MMLLLWLLLLLLLLLGMQRVGRRLSTFLRALLAALGRRSRRRFGLVRV